MQTVEDVGLNPTQLSSADLVEEPDFLDRLQSKRLIIIVVMVVLGFGARVYRLGDAGLSEDEANKIFAVRCYQQGDFSVNTEHPMVMKALCFASIEAAGFWNRTAGRSSALLISDEVAVRLPNALFGALSVIPLFLLGSALLGFRTALMASVFWALGLNVIWFNRVAKEDTLLVFFMLTACYLYDVAKGKSSGNVAAQERLYFFAGAAFGLMLASKYFPHHYGFMALFYLLSGYDGSNNRPLTARMKLLHFGAMALAFAVFNFGLFTPGTARYLSKYLGEDLVTHHGYPMMDSLYNNSIGSTPGLATVYFYGLYFLVKLPIPLLVAFIAGAVEVFRKRHSHRYRRGFLLLRIYLVFWLLPMSLLGSKFLRYTLGFMPFLYLIAAVGILAIGRFLCTWIETHMSKRWRLAPAIAVGAVFVVTPSIITLGSLPFPSLYMNAFGAGHTPGYFFPHDEFYDLGARESIQYVAEHAPYGARVATEIPGVLQYYLERFNRTDIRSEIMSEPRFDLSKEPPDYVLLQRGRFYFENREDFERVRRDYPVTQSSSYRGAAAAEVYTTRAASARR